jgi:hypothetical protein
MATTNSDYDDGMVARDIARQKLQTHHEEIHYARMKAKQIAAQRWLTPSSGRSTNEDDRVGRVAAWKRWIYHATKRFMI